MVAPDGGLWLRDSSEQLLFEQDGTPVDAGDGVYLEGVRRVGAKVFGWHPYDGLFVFEEATGWTRARSEGVVDVWGEPGNVWALGQQSAAGRPVLFHAEADAGWTRYSGANLYPPDFPATADLYTLTGKGSRVMLLGPDTVNVGAWAVEFRR
ncbi:MAG: hypothetical protein ACOZQL_00140 [Myxococcota bacterium]